MRYVAGGLKHGQIIGETDRRGGRVDRDPVGVEDLCATLMHYQFDLGLLRVVREVSPALKRIALDHGRPIGARFL